MNRFAFKENQEPLIDELRSGFSEVGISDGVFDKIVEAGAKSISDSPHCVLQAVGNAVAEALPSVYEGTDRADAIVAMASALGYQILEAAGIDVEEVSDEIITDFPQRSHTATAVSSGDKGDLDSSRVSNNQDSLDKGVSSDTVQGRRVFVGGMNPEDLSIMAPDDEVVISPSRASAMVEDE